MLMLTSFVNDRRTPCSSENQDQGHRTKTHDSCQNITVGTTGLAFRPKCKTKESWDSEAVSWEGSRWVFSPAVVHDQDNTCLSWEDTKAYCEMLGLWTPPIFFEGVWDEDQVRKLWDARQHKSAYRVTQVPDDHRTPAEPMRPTTGEGYVVRVVDSFKYEDFPRSLAKFVRKNHVQTDSFWMSKPVLPNLTEAV